LLLVLGVGQQLFCLHPVKPGHPVLRRLGRGINGSFVHLLYGPHRGLFFLVPCRLSVCAVHVFLILHYRIIVIGFRGFAQPVQEIHAFNIYSDDLFTH
jgi:hypothetical protein